MTNFIPLFPLSIVVYPNEKLNLHIFEPKYQQMITECFEDKKPFGIPVVINEVMNDCGTLMEIVEISNRYPTGEMDIKTQAIKVFEVLEPIHSIPGKLFSGAIVTYPGNDENSNQFLKSKVLLSLQILHKMLQVEKPVRKMEDLRSYDIAHEVGFTLQQEYELLILMDELHRLEYLKRHLAQVIPVVAEMESLKEKIKLNGHFKNISGFNIK
ncbi:MAG: LON peptidase substrate-binding domain-containing protein [Ginsengibacter sp.]